MSSVSSPIVSKFDRIHPASMISLKEEFAVAERVLDGTFSAAEMHPASILCTRDTPSLDGYGDLALMVREEEGLRPATSEEFREAYIKVFQKYAPTVGMRLTKQTRVELMREELTKINPKFVGVFVIRILKELTYMEELVKEDRDHALEVPIADPENPTEKELEAVENASHVSANSWANDGSKGPRTSLRDGIARRLKVGTPECVVRNLDRIVEIAARLNTVLCKRITAVAPRSEHLTFGQMQRLVAENIRFFKEFPSTRFGKYASKFIPNGPSPCFALHMKRKSEIAIQIIAKKALLESLKSCKGKIILSRGCDLAFDYPVVLEGRSYSISYGAGMFAGFPHDRGACAFDFSMNCPHSIDLVVDPRFDSTDVYYVPAYTTEESLLGYGEDFHARFKVGRNAVATLGGGRSHELYTSPLSTEELCAEYDAAVRDGLIVLKSKG